ncbi:PAS/PAC domain-containing protein [Rhodospirillaceae bacterium LM-1]|nr:PAS/PAC domain-containing protein [Rhodospirillaceae bacterium LM-1]
MTDPDTLSPLVLALAVGLVVAVALLALLARRRVETDLALESNNEKTACLTEMLNFSPNGFYRWDADEGQVCSRRLAIMLGLRAGTQTRFEELVQYFGPSDQAALLAGVAGLRREGAGFTQEAVLLDPVRRVRFTGQRISDASDRWLADVLWVEDITQNTETLDRLSSETFVLLTERDRLRAVLNAMTIPVWLRDADLQLVWCNRAYAQAVDAISPAQAVASQNELMQDGSALAETVRAENRMMTQARHLVVDGQRRLFEISEIPLAGGMAGYAQDMTRLEEAHDSLSRHIAAHGEVLERLTPAIAIHGPDTRLAFFNDAYVHLWRLDRAWLSQGPAYVEILDYLRERRLLPEQADFPAFKESELKRFTGLMEAAEDIVHLPDGTTLRRLIAPHPLGGLLFTYENVTDKLALERLYNTMIAVHRQTLDHLHEAVAVFGGDGRLKLFNQALVRLWGLDNAVLMSQPHASWLFEIQRSHVESKSWDGLKRSYERLLAERPSEVVRLERLDGLVLDQASLPLPDGGLLVTWYDVTDSARVQMALIERGQALEAANRLGAEFVASVAAELKAPLEAAVGHADILANAYYGDLNSRQTEHVKGVLESSRLAYELVDAMVELATLEAGRLTLSIDTLDITVLLSGVLALTREAVKAKALTLNYDCPPDIGWMVGDAKRLKQALYNLVSNAVKFTPEGGQITLAASRQGKDVAFTVADTGAGITGADQAALEGTLEAGKPGKGGGIGLVLVKRFVELHGGRIEIASASGEGTTVTLYLPAG